MAETAGQLEEVGHAVAGRYVIEAPLGRGGMSAVYRVRDLRSGALVALKRGFAGSPRKMRKRQELLEREFNTLTQLAHPSIIEVYDYGVDDRHFPYYTMELLDGGDLHDSGQLSWQRVCELLRDVASSLAIVHSRGMIHRDVSSRNVRCTADGRAKLIDFGAMTSMGVAQDVVGTPPFLAPEVLQMQSLDARADLFSLGALAYFLLTGRHAYPARRLHELRDSWRSTPIAPIRLVPDMPVALSALVMQLLALDRSTRAFSAPDVMSRLCTLAGLPVTEQAQVSRAYLTTPTLVGRDRELVTARKHMLSLARGDGGTLLVSGVSGSGRTRMLDACALEAKLVGAQVIRAGANNERADWDVARVLAAQLLHLLPEQAKEAARLSRDVLAQVIDAFKIERIASQSSAPVERNALIRALRDFFLTLARSQRLVIVVDDADLIDEPSAALLAALANKTERHPILLALSVDRESKPNASASLRLLHLVGTSLELSQLSAEQTESLMRSVFGAVAHLPLMAAKIHALSQGNPRAVMELVQHLVDRDLARYQSGSWSLPDRLSERDLPTTLAASLAARLARLSDDAREVCEALCLSDLDGGLPFESCVALSSHRDSKRTFHAFDELVAA
ncbi:MAG TPA: serine/threonine-protein kinase, partial [Polyangiales bacterium]|nr:serine/threonine-protein kinase [Polyangiales bacterium]